MKIGIPQVIWICIGFWGLMRDLENHGKEITRKENFFISLFAAGVSVGLMIWGGFFG